VIVNVYGYCDVSTLHVSSPKLSMVFVLCLILNVNCEIRRSNIFSLRCQFIMISDLHMSQSDIVCFSYTHVTVNLCSYKMCEVFFFWGGGGDHEGIWVKVQAASIFNLGAGYGSEVRFTPRPHHLNFLCNLSYVVT